MKTKVILVVGVLVIVIFLSAVYFSQSSLSGTYPSLGPSSPITSNPITSSPITSSPIPEPYIGKMYPPIDFEPTNVYRLKHESGDGWPFNRVYVNNQEYGNGQYDMAMSSCWYGNIRSLGYERNVYSIFNQNRTGWLSGGGYNYRLYTTENLGLPTGQTNSKLVDESQINGEWVQVTFPQAMDFNCIKLKQTSSGYPIIINLAILAGNDTSLVNAPIWTEFSPLSPQPTPEILPIVQSPVPIKNNWNENSRWEKLVEFTNLDQTPSKVLELSFQNPKKYRSYRLVVTKTDGLSFDSATIDYVKFVKL